MALRLATIKARARDSSLRSTRGASGRSDSCPDLPCSSANRGFVRALVAVTASLEPDASSLLPNPTRRRRIHTRDMREALCHTFERTALHIEFPRVGYP